MRKRKKIIAVIMTCLLLLNSLSFAKNAKNKKKRNIKVWINDFYILSDVRPFIESDRAFVPIRFIAEELDYTVSWDEKNQQVIISKGEKFIKLNIDSKKISVNDKEILLESPPQLKESRTFIPLREITKITGEDVKYNSETHVATIGENFVSNEFYPLKYYSKGDTFIPNSKINFADYTVKYSNGKKVKLNSDIEILNLINKDANSYEQVNFVNEVKEEKQLEDKHYIAPIKEDAFVGSWYGKSKDLNTNDSYDLYVYVRKIEENKYLLKRRIIKENDSVLITEAYANYDPSAEILNIYRSHITTHATGDFDNRWYYSAGNYILKEFNHLQNATNSEIYLKKYYLDDSTENTKTAETEIHKEIDIENDLQYIINEEKVKIIKYTGSAKDIKIPSKIEGKPVTTIADNAFSYKELTTVVIPESVTKIGYKAFYKNKLTVIKIPNSVKTIGDKAFSNNELIKAEIPNSVTKIGNSAFSYNELVKVEIPNSIKTIEDGTFIYNELSEVKIPNSVTKIGNLAFPFNNLRSIEIPESVTEIGTHAFSYNELNTVKIPNSVTKIGDNAFSSNDLAAVEIPNSVTEIGDSAFSNNELIKVKIPNSVTKISDETFFGNKLTEVEMPESVTTIGNRAFIGNNLKSVKIPESVTIIGDEAFSSNELTTIKIPESVTIIGNEAFSSNDLAAVEIPKSVTIIGDSAFSYNELLAVKIPDSVIKIGDEAFMGNNLTYLGIPASVTTIGDKAFFYNKLIEVEIPNSVITIGDEAFMGNNLTSVEIPESVTKIGNSVFYKNKLTTVKIPDSVTTIGNKAFSSNKLGTVKIPKNCNISKNLLNGSFDYNVKIIRN